MRVESEIERSLVEERESRSGAGFRRFKLTRRHRLLVIVSTSLRIVVSVILK